MIPKHDEDFYGWAMANASLLKQKKYQEVDMNMIIEEIEEMGRSAESQLTHRLSLVLTHLLKWQFQPALQGKSWKVTLREQRRASRRLIDKNPSLKSKISNCIFEAYEDAIDEAIKQTGLDEKTFPTECPYLFEQIMDDEFYPT